MQVATYFLAWPAFYSPTKKGGNSKDLPGHGGPAWVWEIPFIIYQIHIGVVELAEDGKLLDAKIMCGGTLISLG